MSHTAIMLNNRAVGDWSRDPGILLGSQTKQRQICPCIRRECILYRRSGSMLNPGSRWCCNSRPGRFNTWEITPGTNYTGRSVNSRANLDVMEKKIISCPYPDSNPGSSSPYRSYDSDYVSPISSQTIEDHF